MHRRISMFLQRLFLVIVSSSLLASSAHAMAPFRFDVPPLYFSNDTNKTIYVTGQHSSCHRICGQIFRPSYTNLCCFGSTIRKKHYIVETAPKGLTIYVYDGKEGKLLAKKTIESCPNASDWVDVTLDSNYQFQQKCMPWPAST